MQVWTPPYLLTSKPRPTINGAPSSLSYVSSFSFGFSGVSSVDQVVINRVISATHGNHFDQRQAIDLPSTVSVIGLCATSSSGQLQRLSSMSLCHRRLAIILRLLGCIPALLS